jgi:hypothetical protein
MCQVPDMGLTIEATYNLMGARTSRTGPCAITIVGVRHGAAGAGLSRRG